MENPSSQLPHVQEYALFSKELLRPQKIEQSGIELVDTLGHVERALGAIDRDIVRNPKAHKAAAKLSGVEKKEHAIVLSEQIGWRTVGSDESGKPINEEFKQEDAAKAREELSLERQKSQGVVRDFVEKNHGYVFSLLHTSLGKNQEPKVKSEIDDFIISEIVHINAAKKGGLRPEVSERRLKTISGLARLLIKHSSKFRHLEPLVKEAGNPSELFIGLSEMITNSQLNQEIAKTSEENRIYSFRQWLIATGQKALVGEQDPITGKRNPLKIYMTPYYENLIKMAEIFGRKENGIGGSIYVGPPGTGKTRLGALANQLEGFDTRVIQIHHYSTFIDLIGERTMQLGLDKSTSYQTRLKAAKDWFNNDSSKAMQGMRDFYSKRHLNGEITEASFEEFMQSFTVTDKDGVIGFKDPEAIQKGFVRYLDSQMAGASLGLETGNVVDEWINGELLLAMSQGKRALLDELDKAGPYSLGGLLTLLARSPGEEFTVGGKVVTIPSWFRVDATANVLSLDRKQDGEGEGKNKEYLYDRFNVVPVGYPPVKDDLMIAAVRLSDGAGNLKITPEEQWQITGIYAYLIPTLRRIYEANPNMAAISHRLTAEFCSFLVSPHTRERTTFSVEQALNMALSKIQSLGTGKAQESVGATTIKHFFNLYQKSSETPQKNPQPKFSEQPVSAKVVDEALASVLNSPLMRAVGNYQIKDLPFSEEQTAQLMDLTSEQRAKLEEHLKWNRENDAQTGLGFELTIQKSGDQYQCVLMGDDLPLLTTRPILSDPANVQTVSDNARIALVRSGEEMDKYKMLKLAWEINSLGEFPIPDKYKNVQLGKDGKFLVANDENGAIYICSTQDHTAKEDKWSLVQGYEAGRMQLSDDGRFLLTEDRDRKHSRIFNLERLSKAQSVRPNADVLLEGDSYDFATPNLAVQRSSNQAVFLKPKTDLDLWVKK